MFLRPHLLVYVDEMTQDAGGHARKTNYEIRGFRFCPGDVSPTWRGEGAGDGDGSSSNAFSMKLTPTLDTEVCTSFSGWQYLVRCYTSLCQEDNAALKILKALSLGCSLTLPCVSLCLVFSFSLL